MEVPSPSIPGRLCRSTQVPRVPTALPRPQLSRPLGPVIRGGLTWTVLHFLRRSRAVRMAGETPKDQVLTKEDSEAQEQLDYVQAQEEASEASEPVATDLAPVVSEQNGAKPLIIKKGKERHADLVNPPIPEGVHPYTPGEGYGSNAIPFAGVSPKTSKRRNPGNRMKTIEMLKKAKKIADKKKEELAQRRLRPPSQLLPLPQHVFQELEEKGWLELLTSEGLEVEAQEAPNDPEAKWINLQISGEEEMVRAGVLRLMSIIVPPRAT
eukprot:s2213_g10.t1